MSRNLQLVIFFLCFPLLIFANPKGAQVVSGNVEVSESGSALEVHASDRAVVSWDHFGIDKGESTHFIQPNASSIIVNRVQGGVSQIDGLLQANGKVYLVNPAGIVVGPDGIIKTAGFLATTLDLKDKDFLLGNELLFKGQSGAKIINLGKIEAMGGDVILLAKTILNEGVLEAPEGVVGIAAAKEVLLKQSGMQRLFVSYKRDDHTEEMGIDQQGVIQASMTELRADGNIYRLAINQQGVIEASGVREDDGRVFLVADGGVSRCSGRVSAKAVEGKGGSVHLLGDQVEVPDGACIDASGELGGGEVLVGGDFQGKNPDLLNSSRSIVEKEALVCADALVDGDGGKVIVWSDGVTDMQGEITARGGSTGGDGGFIEVSALKGMSCSMRVDTSAPNGQVGEFLLDPSDITIGPATTGGYACPFNPPTGATLNISLGDLSTCLDSNNVTLTTSSTFSGANGGTITVNDPGFFWTSNNSLTLQADADIVVFGRLNNSGTNSPSLNLKAGGDITLTAGTGLTAFVIGYTSDAGAVTPDANRGSLSLSSGGDINVTCTTPIPMNIAAKNISMTAGDNVTLGDVSGSKQQIQVQANGGVTATVGGDMELFGSDGSNTSVLIVPQVATFNIGGSLDLFGGSGNSSSAAIFSAGSGNSGSFVIGKDLILAGGDGMIAGAEIGLNSGLTFSVGGDVICQSGNGVNSNTKMISTGGTITFDSIGGDLSLLGGGADSTFSLIGPTVSINNVGGSISLQGGSSGSGTNFVAQIGSSSVDINNVQGSISLRGGTGVSGEGYAQIGPGNVSINGVGGSVLLEGLGGNYAQIGPSSNINISNVGLDLSLIGSSTDSGSYALIGDSGLITFNNIGRDVILQGGTNNSLAQIGGGTIVFNSIGRDVSLTGGQGQLSYAIIGSATFGETGGDISINGIGRNAILAGGTSSDAGFAQVGYAAGPGGDISISSLGGSLFLQGGSGSSLNYAQIGHCSSDGLAKTGDITISDVLGEFSLLGGTTDPSNYAQIGHTNLSSANDIVAIGDIRISRGGADLTITSNEATALIGHGSAVFVGSDSYGGVVSVDVKGSAQITASSTATQALPAGIGFLGEDKGGNTYSATSDLVSLSSRDLTLIGGGDGANPETAAFVGYYNAEDPFDATVRIGTVAVSTLEDINLNAGANGDTVIGAFLGDASQEVAASSVRVSSGGDIFLNPTDTSEAAILTNNPFLVTTGDYSASVAAENITVGNGAALDATVFANQNLTMIADQDIFLRQNAVVEALRGDLTLVVDNAYPNEPEKGDGKIVIDAGASVNSGLFFGFEGRLGIFTSERALNQINAPLNGVVFVPGAFLLNTNIEQWGLYYPNPFGGIPFTIFYKDALPPYINTYALIYSELFEHLHLYDELFFKPKCFLFQYDKACYNLFFAPNGMLTSFDLFDEEVYETLEQQF